MSLNYHPVFPNEIFPGKYRANFRYDIYGTFNKIAYAAYQRIATQFEITIFFRKYDTTVIDKEY